MQRIYSAPTEIVKYVVSQNTYNFLVVPAIFYFHNLFQTRGECEAASFALISTIYTKKLRFSDPIFHRIFEYARITFV